MRQKQKVMSSIATVTEVMGLAAELLSAIRQRTATARENAQRVVRNFGDDAGIAAEQLGRNVRKRLYTGPSAATRVLQLAAGFGVGVAAALLFAPSPGTRTRAKLFETVRPSRRTRSGEQVERIS